LSSWWSGANTGETKWENKVRKQSEKIKWENKISKAGLRSGAGEVENKQGRGWARMVKLVAEAKQLYHAMSSKATHARIAERIVAKLDDAENRNGSLRRSRVRTSRNASEAERDDHEQKRPGVTNCGVWLWTGLPWSSECHERSFRAL
jgi:hypothetical protein